MGGTMLIFSILALEAFTRADKNGGGACAACGILGGWINQYAVSHDKTNTQAIADICTFLPTDLEKVCGFFVNRLGPLMDEILAVPGSTVDTACHCLNLCFISEGYDQTCHIYPMSKFDQNNPTFLCPKTSNFLLNREAFRNELSTEIGQMCSNIPQTRYLCDLLDVKYDSKIDINGFNDYKLPLFDGDSDGFGSKTGGLRGYWWNGLDCNDRDAEVYPGRKPTNGDKRSDSNCNGIRGQDFFGQPLEEKFCANHPAKGIAILGDSASAHFSLPENWFRPYLFNSTTFENIFFALAN